MYNNYAQNGMNGGYNNGGMNYAPQGGMMGGNNPYQPGMQQGNPGMMQGGAYMQQQPMAPAVRTFRELDEEIRLAYSDISAIVDKVSKQYDIPMRVELDPLCGLHYVLVETEGNDRLTIPAEFAMRQQMAPANDPDFFYEARIYLVTKDIYSKTIQTGVNAISIFDQIIRERQGRAMFITPGMMAGSNTALAISLIRALKVLYPDLFEYFNVMDIPHYVVNASYGGEGGVEANGDEIRADFEAFAESNYVGMDIAPVADRVFLLRGNVNGQNNGWYQQGGVNTEETLAAMTISVKSEDIEQAGRTIPKYDIIVTSYMECISANFPDAFEILLLEMTRTMAAEGAIIGTIHVAVNSCIPHESQFMYDPTYLLNNGMGGQAPCALDARFTYNNNEYYYIPSLDQAFSVDSLLGKDTLKVIFTSKKDKADIENLASKADLDAFLVARKCRKFQGPPSVVAAVNPAFIGMALNIQIAGGQMGMNPYAMGQNTIGYGQPQMGGYGGQQPMGGAYGGQQPGYGAQPQMGYGQQQQPMMGQAQPMGGQYMQQPGMGGSYYNNGQQMAGGAYAMPGQQPMQYQY
jgi:hypothetical protein